MGCDWDFNKIFNPTDEQLQQHIDYINNHIRNVYERYGKCCLTCKHCVYVQANPYYDYRSCKFNKGLEIDCAADKCCKKYEFVGYLGKERAANA